MYLDMDWIVGLLLPDNLKVSNRIKTWPFDGLHVGNANLGFGGLRRKETGYEFQILFLSYKYVFSANGRHSVLLFM